MAYQKLRVTKEVERLRRSCRDLEEENERMEQQVKEVNVAGDVAMSTDQRSEVSGNLMNLSCLFLDYCYHIFNALLNG